MAPTRPAYESNSDTCRYTVDLAAPLDDGDQLRSHGAHLVAVALTLAKGYIWHSKQPGFTLEPSPVDFARPATATSQQHHHLEGSTDVTDAVDDEWLVVWLLKHLSLDQQDAVISVDDDDGEFLLIEAADSLPAWLTPQNAANRVWIHQGRLHLVPLEHTSPVPFADAPKTSAADEPLNPSFDPDDDAFLDRAAAILLVRDPAVDTLAPPDVEAAVWARIDGYPAKIKEHHHRTLAYLPTDIALALAEDPSLIAEAVGAFYQREPATLRVVNTMSRFPPAPPLPSSSTSSPPPSTDAMSDSAPSLPPTVLVPTLLTRPLYSQLVLQRFYAPKMFEKAGWTSGTLGKDDERRRSVGMKITCGFEMLYKQTAPLPRQSGSSSSSADLDTVDTASAAYRAYLGTLRKQGFFGEGEDEQVEGSERWQEREREARRGWVRAREDRSERPFAQRVDEAIERARAALTSSSPSSSSTATLPLSTRITNPASLTPQAAAELEDNEDWMALDEQGLEEILATKSSARSGGAQLGDSDLEDDEEEDEDDDEEEGRARGDGMEGVESGSSAGAGAGPASARERAEDRKARKVAQRLEEMAGKVEDFVQGRGAASGALFDDERELDDSDDSDVDDEPLPELSAEERASRMDKLVAGLPAEQWGQASAPAPAAPALDRTGAADDASSASAGAHGPPPPLQQPQPEPQPREPRAPKLEKEVYEGASDLSDESDSENEAMPEGEEGLGGDEVDEGEDGPSVVDEDDLLDLGEEMDEFLKFATETLGLTPAQYEKILSDRRGRGAFVPGPAKEKKTNVLPSAKKASSSSTSSTAPPRPSPAAATAAGNPPPAREPLRNPNLTDFDALMEQMETELARSKGARPAAATATASDDDGPAPTGKYASRQSGRREPHRVVVESLSDSDPDGDDGDDLSAMDAELASLLQGVSGDAAGTDAPMDYNLVKNFLESFQSQGGFAGPAGTLAGRLGFPLPRDAPGEGEGGGR
ncbi:hypothetical protein JCM9279_000833 [Rhodotorula babjevae]